jgi:hypothetical protein
VISRKFTYLNQSTKRRVLSRVPPETKYCDERKWTFSKNMQHEQADLHFKDMQYDGQAAWTCSMGMRYGHMDTQDGYAGWTCRIDMQDGHVTRTCRMDMQHGHAAWT